MPLLNSLTFASRLVAAICVFFFISACDTQKAGQSDVVETPPLSNKTSANPPNIVFILADDLGFHQVGAYGQSKISTPTLDALASDGIKFTQAYAGNTVCSPSRVSLFTGRDGRLMHDNANTIKLRPEDVTWAHVLKQAGYATGLFGKWSLNDDLATGGPLKMGFDTWYGMNNILEGHRQYPEFLWRDDERFALPANADGAEVDYAQALFTEEAIKFIQKEKDRPFFVFLSYSSPHAELDAPEEFLEPYLGTFEEKPYTGMSTGEPDGPYASYYPEAVPEPNATMAAMVSALDAYVGDVVKALEGAGVAENTLIMFSSDNGPHDEGGADPEFFEASKPYKGMKRDLYDGGIHVPMIAHWPAVISAGREDASPWAFADVLPTFAELAGVDLESVENLSSNGVSIAGLLQDDPKALPERILYWEFGKQIGDPNSGIVGDAYQAARKGRWKAVRYGHSNPIELYDILADPGETRDISAEHPEVLREFAELFERHKGRFS